VLEDWARVSSDRIINPTVTKEEPLAFCRHRRRHYYRRRHLDERLDSGAMAAACPARGVHSFRCCRRLRYRRLAVENLYRPEPLLIAGMYVA